MRVLFHSNGALVDSPHFHYSWNYSPKGVIYLMPKSGGTDVLLDMKRQQVYKAIANIGKLLLNYTNKSLVNISNIPNNVKEIDLVHSFNTIPVTTKPYILELESFHSLFIGGAKDEKSVLKITELLKQKNCKKIIFWTQNAYDNFFKLVQSDVIKQKSIVLYPAVPLYKKNALHRVPTIGFIARNFFNKGGELVLPIMNDYVNTNQAKAIIVTDVEGFKTQAPELYKKYYKHIKFEQLCPRQELHKKIFPKIDILFYPGYSDTFGFIFPEAMSHGIPIITLDGCARKELVHSHTGGYVITQPLNQWGFLKEAPKNDDSVDFAIRMAITNILNDRKMRASMAEYNYNLVKSGIFSLYNRNKILKTIYTEALK